MQAGGGQRGGANLEACRAKATPKVGLRHGGAERRQRPRQCRRRSSQGSCAEARSRHRFARAFVAPPRTIADITAILDSEKPDLKMIAELKADADAVPTGKEAREDLAQFYFDRANARAQLGRLADAIADANKAVETGRGVASPT